MPDQRADSLATLPYQYGAWLLGCAFEHSAIQFLVDISNFISVFRFVCFGGSEVQDKTVYFLIGHFIGDRFDTLATRILHTDGGTLC